MRQIKRAGITVATLLALTALGTTIAASASAALPEFEPGGTKGEKLTMTSGTATFDADDQSESVCESDQGSGEFIGTSKKEVLLTFDFAGCTVFGIIGGHSLGDRERVILAHFTGVLCYLNKTKKEVGIKLALPSSGIHIEVAGKLLIVTGTAIGLVKPVNTKSKTGEIILKQSGDVQEFTKCEGGSEETLKTAENEGTAVQTSLQTTDTVTYEKEVELLA
jgi:hypothetical protein